MSLLDTFIKKIELKTKLYEALNTLELNNALSKLGATSFIGVVSKEVLPQVLTSLPLSTVVDDRRTGLLSSPNSSLIFNLDDPDGPGSHWVAIGVKDKTIFYFDSYGNSYPPEEVKIKGFNVLRNVDVFQGKDEPSICGHLCIAFCYLFHITRGDGDKILQEFSKKEQLLKFVAHALI